MCFIATCWGCYPLFHLCGETFAKPNYVAGINFHPSVRVAGFFGEDEFAMAKALKVPQFLLPCGDDPDQYHEGGS